ncbi:hypothetical protein KC207_02075 [Phycicoccus sp. BSK3Z-2]|uniref:Uncharacterized protein n=1 Tax=Phycicoccus avicenniae TaxID=2828860 RepID=A0A941D5N1_9MICO|nr:hypothetical protein [Phycicoccus avicenniae]MBR7742081.1 hypothetical protein [Phycicoccus avicenniae]
MLRAVLAEFGELFSDRPSRLRVSGLVLVLASVPLLEMLAIRLFSGMVTDPRLLTESRTALVLQAGGFFAALAGTRGAHHAARILRPRVFEAAFSRLRATRSRHQESWAYAQAFEVSGVLAGLVQAASFVAVIAVFDPATGAVALTVGAVVLLAMSRTYSAQVAAQERFVSTSWTAEAVGVPDQVGQRVRAAEIGSILATVGLAVALAFLLVQVVDAAVDTATAIMMFLGLRLMFGQLGTVSASAMRFARATVRVKS